MARTTARRLVNRIGPPSGPIEVPYRFPMRSYQAKLTSAMMPHPETRQPEFSRGCAVWHRGAGKDRTAISGIIIPHMLYNPGTYWHIFPKYTQGKKAVWQPQEGLTYTELFPPHLVTRKNDTECLIEMDSVMVDPDTGKPAKSVYQLVGGDTLSEHGVGSGPRGVVFSEWPIMDEGAYQYVEPRLLQNDGWALFLFTPRGKNHGFRTYQAALANRQEWFTQLLTVEDTRRDGPGEDGRPVIGPEAIARARASGTPDEIIQQEYFCSFDGYLRGTIFGDLLKQARMDGRVTRVVRDVNVPVGACFDIGRSDGTAVWFYQMVGQEIRLIDYFSCQRKGADYVAHVMKERRPYHYGRIQLPHDATVTGYSATKSTEEYFRHWWPGLVHTAEKWGVQQGIDAVRRHFSRFVFDEVRCAADQEDRMPSGLDCLAGYHREWNEDRQDFSGPPDHDIHSHGADALRTGAVEGFRPLEIWQEPASRRATVPWADGRSAGRTVGVPGR